MGLMSIKERGNAIYQLFLLLLSIYVLSIVFVETFLVSDPELSNVFQKIDLWICFIFLFDFFYNIYKADSKLGYLKWGWIDLLSSIPMFDPLRWGRLARVIRIVRFLRTIKSLKVLIVSIQQSKFQSLTLLVGLISFVAFTVCAALILDLEREYGGTITTANDALWWAFLNIMNAKVAISQAQSTGGMIATIVLNKVGILLFAYFNAIIIAWLIQKRIDLKSGQNSSSATSNDKGEKS